MNTVFDDLKPMLCTNAGTVNKQFEKAQNRDETCTSLKNKLEAQINADNVTPPIPAAVKRSIIDLNNTMVDSVCGSDNKLDEAKANALGSDIKGMFC